MQRQSVRRTRGRVQVAAGQSSTTSISSCKGARSSRAGCSIQPGSRCPKRASGDAARLASRCPPPRLLPAPARDSRPTISASSDLRSAARRILRRRDAAQDRRCSARPRTTAHGTSPQDRRAQRSATTFYPGTPDQAAAQPVAVAAGAEVGNIVFTMQSVPSFRVSGIVVDEQRQAGRGRDGQLMGDPRSGMFMGPVGGTRTQANGRFDIDDVPAGSYRVNASVMMTFSGAGAGSGRGGWVSETYVSSGTVPPEPAPPPTNRLKSWWWTPTSEACACRRVGRCRGRRTRQAWRMARADRLWSLESPFAISRFARCRAQR